MGALRQLAIFLGIFMLLCVPGKLTHAQTIEHAVIVHFNYGSKDLTRLFALEDKLESAISKADVGEYDGNEIAADGSDGFLYMYGPDADRLFSVVKPILDDTPFMRGAKVTLRYGSPKDGVKEKIIVINP
jgi:hypothetical protein